MTDSIARFQREAAQRERLSSLGRLSTVVAHEIRNPLMIIKAALHALRGRHATPEDVRAAVADIDEEIARLNRIVSDVLDFARPIKFELATADLNALCEDAAGGERGHARRRDASTSIAARIVTTDPERLRLALVNILMNARHAVMAPAGSPPPDPIRLKTLRLGATGSPSRSAIAASVLLPRICRGSSIRTSPPAGPAPAWDWRSPAHHRGARRHHPRLAAAARGTEIPIELPPVMAPGANA